MKKLVNRGLIMCVVLSFILLLAACQPKDTATTKASTPSDNGGAAAATPKKDEPAKKKKTFAVSVMTMNNPFWVYEIDSLKKVIEKNGDTLTVFDAQLDQSKQISQIEDAIQSKVDLLFISPYDFKGIKPALDSAKKAGIPVVNIDTSVFDQDLVETQVISDNYQAGVQAGEALVKALGGKGDIGIIDLTVNQVVQERVKGFLSVIKKNPDIKVVSQQDGNGSLEAALPIMENMLQSNKNIKGVFGINDPTSLGAIAALESAKKLKDVTVVSVDGAKDAIAMIKDGKMAGTSAQYPNRIAEKSAEQAYKILNKEKVEKTIVIPVEWIDKDKAGTYVAY